MLPDTLPPIRSPAELTTFHGHHKMDLLARTPEHAYRLGQLAAAARPTTFVADLAAYAEVWGLALACEATIGKHVNVLHHLLGHVRDRAAAQELRGAIAGYKEGGLPLEVVKRALRLRLVAEGAAWAAEQSYLAEARVAVAGFRRAQTSRDILASLKGDAEKVPAPKARRALVTLRAAARCPRRRPPRARPRGRAP